jgi:hypothetical protein
MNIIIVGLARNLEKRITKNVANLIKAFEKFGEVTFYVVESDSQDSTLYKLEELTKNFPRFHYKSLGNLELSFPNRIERLQYCRNNYVSYIRQIAAQHDFVCVADLDGINNQLSWSSVGSSFSSNVDWDMCSANQKFGYFDLYALRKKLV